MRDTRHVVLVTYGEPPSPSFVDQLVYSWRILVGLTRTVAPIPRALLPMIAVSRARSRRQAWRKTDYASPLEPITERQAHRLQEALAASGGSTTWTTHAAFEFREPRLSDVLASIPADDPIVVLPMYATESAFTHALSRNTVASDGAALRRLAPIRVLSALDPQVLAEASAMHVLRQTSEGGWRGRDVAVVLAAHGTLLEPVKPIDTGLEATETLCRAISSRLAEHFGLVVNGWLNHTKGGRWTEPPIDDALQRVADAGFRRVVYFPYGFLADNAESELEGRIALERQPSLHARHVPCLNDSSDLVLALARQIQTAA